MKFWQRKFPRMSDLYKPYSAKKERQFQEWLAVEMPKRADLQNVHVIFQRASFELRDRLPAFEFAYTMEIFRLEGLRFQAAIANMRAGRALEYKNVRFRKTKLFVLTATVQVRPKMYSYDDAIEAFAYAESVLRELRQKWSFRSATLFCKPILTMAFETEPRDMEPDHIYYRKVGSKIENLRDYP